ncbi:MAG: MATE family efflux transporter [Selenomonadaceae bacterium]|nr:MATE family efflux transporter [Selenomonadaceae bacterium]
MSTRSVNMLSGPLYRELLAFSMPIAVTAILEQLFNAADTMVLGRFEGTAAMAAVGNNVTIISLIVALLLGISLGANVVIAQYIGARRLKEATRTIHTTLLFSLLLGIVIAVGGQPLVSWSLDALAVPPAVQEPAAVYLRIFLAGMPFLSLYNFAAAILRSRGDAQTPLYALIIASVLNIVLDLAFVLIFDWGTAGVAIATVLSYLVCALHLIRHMLRTYGILHLEIGLLRIHVGELVKCLRIGLPAALQGMVFCIANLVIQNAINSLGPEVMAASAAAFTIEINMYCFVTGFQQACTTFVGQNYGARQLARCQEVVRDCFILTAVTMILLAVLIYIFMRPMLGFFSTNPVVIENAITRIEYVVLPEFICTGFDISSSALRGYGVSLAPAIATLISVCGVRLIGVWWYFPMHPTFANLMVLFPISWIVADVLIISLYRMHLKHLRY